MAMNLPSDVKVGGLDVYHEGNLDKSQFVNQKEHLIITPKTNATDIHYKICTIDLSDKDRYTLAAFTIYDLTYPDTKVVFADIMVKAFIQGEVATGNKAAYLLCTNSNGFAYSNIIGVISKNDSTGLTLDVYLSHPSSNRKYVYIPRTNTSNRAGFTGVTFHSDKPCVASLGAGIQIVCSGLEGVVPRIYNVAVNFGDILPNTMAIQTVTCTGVKYGDIITVSPSDAPSISTQLLWGACSKGTNQVELRVYNVSNTTKTVNSTFKISATT